VEAFDGCLIYSGGDDVLALLPSGNALACAQALRHAFRGSKEELNQLKGGWDVDREKDYRKKNPHLPLFDIQHPGFVQLHRDNYLSIEGEPRNFPAMVPGPATECSVGIAVAHFKAPLQDVVRAAQLAEKRAKKQLGRAAVAVSLFKRSGEITEWGCRWSSHGLELYDAIAKALGSKAVSAKFPHRVCQLLEPYLVGFSPLMEKQKTMQDALGFDAGGGAEEEDNAHKVGIIEQEFRFAILRQSAPGKAADNEAILLPLLRNHLKAIRQSRKEADETRAKDGKPPLTLSPAQELLTSVIGLCTTVAFTHRTRSEPPKGNSAP
jgi:hypothetical protein